jgi:hypothetical protein
MYLHLLLVLRLHMRLSDWQLQLLLLPLSRLQ